MIPKIFHRIWVGGPMPDHLADYGATWEKHHPGWEHRLWTDDNMPALRNQHLYDQAETIAPNNVGQFRADIARYELLGAHGGVYIDCDFECLRPIDELLDGVSCFAAWEETGRWVNNAIMGCTLGHTLMSTLVARLPRNVKLRRGARPNILSGPQFLTPLIAGHGVTVFDKDLFYPYLWNELERGDEQFPDAYAVHHWNNRRTR